MVPAAAGWEGSVSWRRSGTIFPDGEVKAVAISGVFQWEDNVIPTPDWQSFLA